MSTQINGVETGDVEAIQVKTDNLPTDPADQSDVESAITTAHSTTDGKVDGVKTVVDAVQAKTDNLPTDPADQSAVEAAITSAHATTDGLLNTIGGYLDTEIGDIKAKTDNLPTDPADQSAVESAITSAHSTTDGKVDAVAALVAATVAGKFQMAITTESLNQAVGPYDLLTGTTQAVVLEKLNVKMPTGAAGGDLTSISIQTDDATPGVIISAANGAVANLTSEADLSWTGSLLINVGTKIQLTIAGGAHGSAYSVTVIAQCRAVVSGGYLAVSA